MPKRPVNSVKICIFAYGKFIRIAEQVNRATAYAYALGMIAGAALYGHGCATYVMPDEERHMRVCEHQAEVDRALAAFKQAENA